MKDLQPIAAVLGQRYEVLPMLNAEHLREIQRWAADDSLWTTPEHVEFNLRIFARVILAASR